MINHRIALLLVSLFIFPMKLIASPDSTQLSVWANEAIVATYTYDHNNFLPRQKEIAHYFTSSGWIHYSKALQDSKIPESVKQNAYSVSAVALMPPVIKTIKPNQWQAIMPILVIYKNPQYTQKQTLEITLDFTSAPNGQGVRGLEILQLIAKITQVPCECALSKSPSVTIT